MSAPVTEHPHVLDLGPGEVVRVRSAEEIFATLDERGALDGVPFMPEMVKYCGRTLPVSKRADKTCDSNFRLRRMENTVHLANLRCDGSGHDGCRAACFMYWKEAWLERTGPAAQAAPRDLLASEQAFVSDTLVPATTRDDAPGEGGKRYRCQATEITAASTPLPGWRPDQYVRDVRNWGLLKVLRGLVFDIFNTFQAVNRRFFPRFLVFRGGLFYPFLKGEANGAPPEAATLDLQPGERVRIKSRAEIVKTLNDANRYRGLSFDVEQLPYCGRTARVQARVNRLIDERTGEMITIKTDCIILEDVVCKADFHRFCTRSTYPYWREAWLERID